MESSHRQRSRRSRLRGEDGMTRTRVVILEVACLLAAGAFVGTLVATVSLPPQTQSLAITHVNVVDVIDGRILPNMTVTTSGATITGVTPNGTPKANTRIVDGT